MLFATNLFRILELLLSVLKAFKWQTKFGIVIFELCVHTEGPNICLAVFPKCTERFDFKNLINLSTQ
jgi:hypothetical protein